MMSKTKECKAHVTIKDVGCNETMPKPIKKLPTRLFGGVVGNKVSDFKDKQERAFEKKHLKAYLNGWTRFRYGFEGDQPRVPVYHDVKIISIP